MAAILNNISIAIVNIRNNCNLKIAVQMSELSQLTELNNLSNDSAAPNLATPYRLAGTASYSFMNCVKQQLFWQQFVI